MDYIDYTKGENMKDINKGRICLLLVIILSTVMAFMLWNAIEWNPIVMFYALPAGLYIPVVAFIILVMTFRETKSLGG